MVKQCILVELFNDPTIVSATIEDEFYTRQNDERSWSAIAHEIGEVNKELLTLLAK